MRAEVELRRATRAADMITGVAVECAAVMNDPKAHAAKRVDATSMLRAALESLGPALVRLARAQRRAGAV